MSADRLHTPGYYTPEEFRLPGAPEYEPRKWGGDNLFPARTVRWDEISRTHGLLMCLRHRRAARRANDPDRIELHRRLLRSQQLQLASLRLNVPKRDAYVESGFDPSDRGVRSIIRRQGRLHRLANAERAKADELQLLLDGEPPPEPAARDTPADELLALAIAHFGPEPGIGE